MKGPNFGKLREIRAPDLWDEIEHRMDTGATREHGVRAPFASRLAVYATTLVLAVAAVVLVATALRTETRRSSAAAASTATVTATPRAAATAANIPMNGQATAIAVGPSGIWAADTTGLVRINPATNRVASRVSAPSGIPAIAVGSDVVWATDSASGRILRVDPGSGSVTTIGVGENPTDVAIDENGSVWVVSHNGGTLVRIDPSSNKVVATQPVAGELTTLVVGGGAVWVASDFESAIYSVDVLKGTSIGDPIPVGGRVALTFAEGRLWVASTSGDLLIVDPSTHEVTDAIAFASEGLASDFVDASFDGTYVWAMKTSASDNDTTIAQLDARTGKLLSTSKVAFRATSVVSSDGSLWLLPAGGDSVIRNPV